jgi:hypothetical protein
MEDDGRAGVMGRFFAWWAGRRYPLTLARLFGYTRMLETLLEESRSRVQLLEAEIHSRENHALLLQRLPPIVHPAPVAQAAPVERVRGESTVQPSKTTAVQVQAKNREALEKMAKSYAEKYRNNRPGALTPELAE